MKNIFSFIVLTFFILFSACSTKETKIKNINLLHDIWALESIDGEKIDPVAEENVPMLEIYVEEERIHGNTGCNIFDGNIKINENKISFSDIVTTKIFCPSSVELKFLSALGKVNNYKTEKMRLFLYEDEVLKLVFKKID